MKGCTIFSVSIAMSMALCFFSCTRLQKTNGGSALLTTRMIVAGRQTSTAPNFYKDRKFWFKDSGIIAEGFTVYVRTIHAGAQTRQTWEAITDKFTFVDLRTHTFYDYSHFSDTARLLEKYVQPDTGEVKGGWKFFSKIPVIYTENMEDLPDTMIQDIAYKRVRSFRNFPTNTGNTKVLQIGYLRCDKKNTLFKMDNLFSLRRGCPLVREDRINAATLQGISTEWIYGSEPLTINELKVFSAWEKNAAFARPDYPH